MNILRLLLDLLGATLFEDGSVSLVLAGRDIGFCLIAAWGC